GSHGLSRDQSGGSPHPGADKVDGQPEHQTHVRLPRSSERHEQQPEGFNRHSVITRTFRPASTPTPESLAARRAPLSHRAFPSTTGASPSAWGRSAAPGGTPPPWRPEPDPW